MGRARSGMQRITDCDTGLSTVVPSSVPRTVHHTVSIADRSAGPCFMQVMINSEEIRCKWHSNYVIVTS